MYRYIKSSKSSTLEQYSYFEFIKLLDDIVPESYISTSEDILSTDTVDGVATNSDFIKDLKKLNKSHHKDAEKLKEIVKNLMEFKVPTDRSLYDAHHLQNSNYSELKIKRNVLLLFRYISETLVVLLELADIDNHDNFDRTVDRLDKKVSKNEPTSEVVFNPTDTVIDDMLNT